MLGSGIVLGSVGYVCSLQLLFCNFCYLSQSFGTNSSYVTVVIVLHCSSEDFDGDTSKRIDSFLLKLPHTERRVFN